MVVAPPFSLVFFPTPSANFFFVLSLKVTRSVKLSAGGRKNSRPAAMVFRERPGSHESGSAVVLLSASQSRVYQAHSGAHRGIFAAQFRFPPCLIMARAPVSGVGGGSLARSFTRSLGCTTVHRQPYRRVRCVDVPTRRGCWGAAAIAPLGPSFVRGCRATSVFLFQRRR